MKLPLPVSSETLKLLSLFIPARDEEECLAGAVEPLPVELRLNAIPHEIPMAHEGERGFGRAITLGCDRVAGGAALATMAADGLARKSGGGIYSGA